MPRFVPICSDFFRFVFRTNQNKSGKPLSADPFCKSPIQVLVSAMRRVKGSFALSNLKTLLRSALLHYPLGVHPNFGGVWPPRGASSDTHAGVWLQNKGFLGSWLGIARRCLGIPLTLWSADGATGPGISKPLKWHFRWLKNDFSGPRKSDPKITQILTLSQGKVISGVIFESLFLDPEKSFLSHWKSHFWVRDLWPNGVSQL